MIFYTDYYKIPLSCERRITLPQSRASKWTRETASNTSACSIVFHSKQYGHTLAKEEWNNKHRERSNVLIEKYNNLKTSTYFRHNPHLLSGEQIYRLPNYLHNLDWSLFLLCFLNVINFSLKKWLNLHIDNKDGKSAVAVVVIYLYFFAVKSDKCGNTVTIHFSNEAIIFVFFFQKRD